MNSSPNNDPDTELNLQRLYPDTNLIPWPNFFLAALKRRKDFAMITGIAFAVAAAVVVSLGYAVALPATFLIIAVVMAMMADAKLTRNVVVYLKETDGSTYQDHQKWWVEDSMLWPDESKPDHKGKRVLWIDGTIEDHPVAFRPWLAPIPEVEIDSSTGTLVIPVTGSRVASVQAKNKSISRIQKYTEPTTAAKLRQGLLVGALIAGLLAILMGVNRAAEIMGFGA